MNSFEEPVPGIESQTCHGEPSRGSDNLSRDLLFNNTSPVETNLESEHDSFATDFSPVIANNKDVTSSSNRKRKLNSRNPIVDSSITNLLHTNKEANTNTTASRNTASHSVPGGERSTETDLSLAKYEVLCEELFERIRTALVVDECNTGRKSNRRKCVVGSNVSHEFKIYEYVIQITDKNLISLDKTS